ncbi:TetR/AcrR family transcriptional regulator [Nonomuraea sp. NPDC046802]|uniref:TetR/AcrR family transcriptional regulator n=1 Tax=Nonomuraea sp. NPDC046802 TaxID=3154919 RepID=UPI0033E032B9
MEAKIGSGTVVNTHPGRRQPPGTGTGTAQPPPRPKPQETATKQALNRDTLLSTAIAIADVEGLDAVSMRRIAADLGVGPMSLYRHVSNKDELAMQMADEVFGESELPVPGPQGWRPKLELISRVAARMQEALTLHSLVATVALSMADEAEAEQETGMTLARWYAQQRARADELFVGGRFPLLAELHEDTMPDLDALFEYSLARHLDGLAVLLGEPVPTAQGALGQVTGVTTCAGVGC